MKKILLFILVFLSLSSTYAQKEDAVWLTGYLGGDFSPKNDSFGHSIMTFSDFGKLEITNNQDIAMDFSNTSQSICNQQGELLFFTEGSYIMDTTYLPMQGGDSLVIRPKDIPGLPFVQNSIILPYPDKEDKYIMLHCVFSDRFDMPGFPIHDTVFYQTIIDMNENNGLGAVIDRKNPVINDTLLASQVTAVRHANGRDWWVLKNESLTNSFYSILVDPSGCTINKQSVGDTILSGVGQAKFSPDGKHFAFTSSISVQHGSFVEIYDFDRLTGKLSNHREIFYPVTPGGSSPKGLEFSPNSRFLYVGVWEWIEQYDMLADDLESSKNIVAVHDGYWEIREYAKTTFVYLATAPDGKIYISTAWGHPYLHIINHPNRKGVACDVVQRAIHLPNHNDCIPNFPNFRLGPIDGSPADTLDIDNNPIANFRPDQDTLNHLKIDFTDLSYYEPKTWHWTFGDGGTSDEVNPLHTYPKDGIYEVCLTVSNENSENTACTTLNLGMVAVEDIQPQIEINAFPNPMTDYVNLIMNDYFPRDGSISFYDVNGVLLKKAKMRHGVNGFDVSGFQKGVVIYKVMDAGTVISNGKLIRN